MIKDKFGKKPDGYKAPGWQVDVGQDEIIKKHFKWMQINKAETACFYDKDFFFFPVTYSINDIGLYIPRTIFFISHMSNHTNKNVIDMENYLLFRYNIKMLKEKNFKLIYNTLSEMREEVLLKL